MNPLTVAAEDTSALVRLADAVDLTDERDLLPGWSEQLLESVVPVDNARGRMSAKFLDQLSDHGVQMAITDIECLLQRFTTAFAATGGRALPLANFSSLYFMGAGYYDANKAFDSLARVVEKKLGRIVDAVTGMLNSNTHDEPAFERTIQLLDCVESVCRATGTFLAANDPRKNTDANVYIGQLDAVESAVNDAYNLFPKEWIKEQALRAVTTDSASYLQMLTSSTRPTMQETMRHSAANGRGAAFPLAVIAVVHVNILVYIGAALYQAYQALVLAKQLADSASRALVPVDNPSFKLVEAYNAYDVPNAVRFAHGWMQLTRQFNFLTGLYTTVRTPMPAEYIGVRSRYHQLVVDNPEIVFGAAGAAATLAVLLLGLGAARYVTKRINKVAEAEAALPDAIAALPPPPVLALPAPPTEQPPPPSEPPPPPPSEPPPPPTSDKISTPARTDRQRSAVARRRDDEPFAIPRGRRTTPARKDAD